MPSKTECLLGQKRGVNEKVGGSGVSAVCVLHQTKGARRKKQRE